MLSVCKCASQDKTSVVLIANCTLDHTFHQFYVLLAFSSLLLNHRYQDANQLNHLVNPFANHVLSIIILIPNQLTVTVTVY